MSKRIKKACFAAIVLALCIGTSTISMAQSVPKLSDASEWARAEIVDAQYNGLLTEKLLQNFQRNITREELCELIVKLFEQLTGKDATQQHKNPFTDTENTAIISAYYLGIVNGTGEGRFMPNATATREEVSVMLYRTLRNAGVNVSNTRKNQTAFSDWYNISDWAHEAVITLRAADVIDGVGNNLFMPQGTTTREQAIVLVKRVFANFSDRYNKAEYTGVPVSRGDARNEQIARLKQLIPLEMGKPYQWGGTGPNSYDCSGLVYTLYGKLGISLPRVSAEQATAGTYVAKKDLQYGDLVFFARDGKNVNHVGIYVGNGEFVHAPQTGDVVKKSSLLTGYYNNTYYTARRVLQ